MAVRKHRIMFIVAVIVLCYMLSYGILSRIGMNIAEESWGVDGGDGFMYVPTANPDLTDWKIHLVLSVLYYPLWAMDHLILGTPEYWTSLPLERFGK